MPVLTLPNGMVAETRNGAEAAFLYHEIFERGAYLQHGLAVRDGDCVFDVGANVGLFSASLADRYRDLRLVAFEPVAPTCSRSTSKGPRELSCKASRSPTGRGSASSRSRSTSTVASTRSGRSSRTRGTRSRSSRTTGACSS